MGATTLCRDPKKLAMSTVGFFCTNPKKRSSLGLLAEALGEFLNHLRHVDGLGLFAEFIATVEIDMLPCDG